MAHNFFMKRSKRVLPGMLDECERVTASKSSIEISKFRLRLELCVFEKEEEGGIKQDEMNERMGTVAELGTADSQYKPTRTRSAIFGGVR